MAVSPVSVQNELQALVRSIETANSISRDVYEVVTKSLQADG